MKDTLLKDTVIMTQSDYMLPKTKKPPSGGFIVLILT